jgi:uncharacterized protein
MNRITANQEKGARGYRQVIIILGIICLVFVASFLSPGIKKAAAAIPDPPADLYVLDQAGVMSSATKSVIISTSQELARQTKAQVAVVTLTSLDGQSIEDVALQIGRKWQLGDKQLNNGVLILVATSEHQSRIEVGYGLEGALPDGKTGRIQDDYMLPAFRQGNYDLGISDGYKAVVAEVAKEYGVTLSNIPVSQSEPSTAPAAKKVSAWVTILWVLGIILLIWLDNRFLNGFIMGLILGAFFRGGGRGGGGFGGGGFGGGSSGGGGSFGGGGSSRGW